MSLLDYKNKFSITTSGRFVPLSAKGDAPQIQSPGFQKWSNVNMYRTSYNDMSNRGTPVAKKNFHIPGYQGYVPGDKLESDHLGLTYAQLTRRSFTKERLDAPENPFATTGFNASRIPKTDSTMHAIHTRYGKTTVPVTHPCIWDNKPTTTTRETFSNPRFKPRNNLRQKISYKSGIDFDNSMKPPKAGKAGVTASGFFTAMNFFDGTTWQTEKNLHTDQVRTEYRNRFNQPKPFQKSHLRIASFQVPKKTLVYDREGPLKATIQL